MTDETRRTRTPHPLTAATRDFDIAKKRLARANKRAEAVQDILNEQSAAYAAYDDAKAALAKVWESVTAED